MASPSGAGLYTADFTPIIAGTYTVTVHLTNPYTETDVAIPTELEGSPFKLEVDQIVDPFRSYTDLPLPTIPT